ncbi:hypothetical protein [Vibrio owensii]|uniref:hypothetical protein n=1 Tax=Vibrio owensii TaxID=696485 RepID=UPI0005972EE8|nr:hypothetical protein [Vibrio owensii]
MKIVLLDCDCIRTDGYTFSNGGQGAIKYIAVANHSAKLPKTPTGKPLGKVAPVFKNSSDFMLLYLLTKLLMRSKKLKGDNQHKIAIVTRDKALIEAIQMVAQHNNARCYHYPRIKSLENDFYAR